MSETRKIEPLSNANKTGHPPKNTKSFNKYVKNNNNKSKDLGFKELLNDTIKSRRENEER